MKHTRTGDTITARTYGSKGVSSELAMGAVVLNGVPTPPAVFSVALYAESTSQQRDLDSALARLLAEDPSLKLSEDPRSGEALLSGMGQLHLDIVCDRLGKMIGTPIHVSKPRVTYLETIQNSVEHTEIYETLIGSSRMKASLCLRLDPIQHEIDTTMCHGLTANGGSHETRIRIGDNEIILNQDIYSNPSIAASIEKGIAAGLRRGPLLGSPTSHVRATVVSPAEDIQASSPAALSACANCAVSNALLSAKCLLLEPVMQVECHVPDSCVGDVINELTHPSERRGIVQNVDRVDEGSSSSNGDPLVRVQAIVPLAGMLDWATRMRSTTKGRGDFAMRFDSYQVVSDHAQDRILVSLRQ
jgi:elongation factor G